MSYVNGTFCQAGSSRRPSMSMMWGGEDTPDADAVGGGSLRATYLWRREGQVWGLRLPPPQSTETCQLPLPHSHVATQPMPVATQPMPMTTQPRTVRTDTHATYCTTHTPRPPCPRHVLGRVLIEHAPAVIDGDTSGYRRGREYEQTEAGHNTMATYTLGMRFSQEPIFSLSFLLSIRLCVN